MRAAFRRTSITPLPDQHRVRVSTAWGFRAYPLSRHARCLKRNSQAERSLAQRNWPGRRSTWPARVSSGSARARSRGRFRPSGIFVRPG